ncbi:MAG TPA: hypothetical protein VGR20_06305 [Acidimicrobiia bacterium]|nr:hypothetical protein [Acidimicrobiia bacterium]
MRPPRHGRSLVGFTSVTVALLVFALGGPVQTASAATSGSPFQIGLIGDTGYTASQDADLLAVRTSMAGYPLAFETHDGDIQKQGAPCTDSRLQYVRGVFDGFAAPFVYTPGDNEWKNCPSASSRLSAVRRTFFSGNQTLGRTKMSVSRQSGTPENARWSRSGVWFATLNVPGPNGAGGPIAADVAWLNGTFDAAEAAGARGVMFISQDNPFSNGSPAALLSALKARTKQFGKPVVFVHGDTHTHRIDKPWSDVKNFTRVETFAAGGSRRWVKATVNPASAAVFSFTSITAR